MRLTTGKRLGTGKYGRFQADEALLLPYVTNHFVFHIGRYTLPLPCLFDLTQQFPNQPTGRMDLHSRASLSLQNGRHIITFSRGTVLLFRVADPSGRAVTAASAAAGLLFPAGAEQYARRSGGDQGQHQNIAPVFAEKFQHGVTPCRSRCCAPKRYRTAWARAGTAGTPARPAAGRPRW